MSGGVESSGLKEGAFSKLPVKIKEMMIRFNISEKLARQISDYIVEEAQKIHEKWRTNYERFYEEMRLKKDA